MSAQSGHQSRTASAESLSAGSSRRVCHQESLWPSIIPVSDRKMCESLRRKGTHQIEVKMQEGIHWLRNPLDSSAEVSLDFVGVTILTMLVPQGNVLTQPVPAEAVTDQVFGSP